MFDIWEHAFYLQYRNVKADYVGALDDRQLGQCRRALRSCVELTEMDHGSPSRRSSRTLRRGCARAAGVIAARDLR
ncbi:MAG: Fe-Mn family superoxide dismutase [Ilumatobacteraceae bacterium]